TLQTTEHEPYGKMLNRSNDNRPGYTGHMMDKATGLVYMQQRYYDPLIPRFLSVDPITAYSNPVGAFNRYWYADNNPYSFADPDGRAKAAVWIVRLVQGGVEKVARVSKERAVELRRQGGQELDIGTNRRQLSHQIENAANSGRARRDVAHDLKDGSGKGLPHYQTDGVRGHTFWGKLSVAAASAVAALDQVAEAAEYIPDAAPRPAEQADISRFNNAMGAISKATGLPMPGVKMGQDGGFQGVFRVEGRLDSKRLDEEFK
ncbi:hypothetical protein CQ393_17475, partial [Stenotrophomonas sp. MYb238]|uniref:RHS repeat-associated core domain-containing protein n=1 Tax=Stenotrophomonas sp. MYb238 TaxID=2040281 RepID=UPI00132CC08E